jgi:hypothetical protein
MAPELRRLPFLSWIFFLRARFEHDDKVVNVRVGGNVVEVLCGEVFF